MQPTRLKLVFFAVALLQPVQYAFVRLVTEPYPALIMPGFGSPNDTGTGSYTSESVDLVVLFADGTSNRASTRELMLPAPSSHLVPMLRWVFHPRKQREEEPASSIGAFLKRYVLRAYAKREHSRGDGFEGPETRAWLTARLHEMFPHQELLAAEFRWMTDVYTMSAAGMNRQRTTKGVRRVELDSVR